MSADGVWVLVKGRRIRHVASVIVRYNRDIVADFLILRETRLRIEGIAYLYVRRPSHTGIGTK